MADYNRGIKLPSEILNQQEMRSLLAACNRGPSGARNRALLVVLWRAGLRTAEALARRAGIRKRAHLHGLRHSHAVELVREGAPLPEVKAQLGHSSLSVTSRYLDHVLPEDLAYRARSRPCWTESSLPLS